MNECAGRVGERRGDLDRHVVQLAELDRARVHDPRAELRELEHLLVADLVSLRASGTTRGSAV